MILLPTSLRTTLRTNHLHRLVDGHDGGRFDPVPVLKLFNPQGAATWIATELAADGDTLFGLADLGFGTPELGTFSLAEIAAMRLPSGRAIERDRAFATSFSLSVWADIARRAGSILWAEILLSRTVEVGSGPGLPPSTSGPDSG